MGASKITAWGKALIIAAIALLNSVILFLNIWAGVICIIVSAAVIAAVHLRGTVKGGTDEEGKYCEIVDIPLVFVDKREHIAWGNRAFHALAGMNGEGKRFIDVVPGIGNFREPRKVNFKSSVYETSVVVTEAGWLISFTDASAAERYSRLYEEGYTVAAIVQLDNYDDMIAQVDDARQSMIGSETWRTLDEKFRELDGFCQRTDRDKFLCVFQKKHLESLQRTKFSLLDDIRKIDAGNAGGVSVSIGVGSGVSPKASQEYAKQALEMAIDRGGDQAVIKNKDKVIIYGGRRHAVKKSTKVKSRSFAKTFRTLMQACEHIYVTGHISPDLDSLGASVGVARCAKSIGKPVSIIAEHDAPAIEELRHRLLKSEEYKDAIITPEAAYEKMGPKSMLVVVDTQLKSRLAIPEMLDKCGTLVVMDHHRRGHDSIDNAALSYLEPYASSICELMTEVIQYFSEDIKLLPIEAGALLSGIIIDTKGFTVKTGVRTFEAAAYLRKAGANTTAIRSLFQDDINSFKVRSGIVQSAAIMENGIAIARCPDMHNAALISAQAADALTGIRGVEASFVLSKANDGVNISGRSLGGINVQLMLEKLGGGGHLSIAGAYIRKATIDEAECMLKEAIEIYEKEAET
ncbi:MAG: DHH family phosphoesterase [Christensenellales bacterium]|jgi:c-di-AMP phosphodiesterase-like protein